MNLQFTVQAQKIQWSNPTRAPVEGSYGEVSAQFLTDSEWEGRTITVVFSNEEGGAPLPEPILWTGEPVKVPASVLVDGVLRVGLVGVKDGNTLTTQYMARGVPVHRSGGTSGEAIDPDPALWEQVLSAMGNLAELDTVDKSSLVAAVNEVYRTGGGGSGGGVDAAEVEKIVAAFIAANPYQETDPNVPNWAKQPNRPSYSAADVGADPAGTAGQKVGTHNVAADSHNDIRLLISGINARLNAFFDSDDATLDELSEIVAYIKSNKLLIEAITDAKVNVSDIINNLTTNVANKPLSAAQGVVLKGLIDDLTGSLSGYALKTELPDVPVKSVNGKTGAVQLNAADVKARSDTWLPTPAAIGAATTEALGQLSAEKAKHMVYYTDRSVSMSDSGVTVDAALYVLYDALQSVYPDYISKNALGKDSAGNTIYEYVFTTGNYNSKAGQREQDDVIKKPVVLLVSGVHGYEKPAVFSTFQLLRDLANDTKALSPLREGVTFKVVPVAVPCSFNSNARVNANGVNINRNFDWNWTFSGSGTSNYSGASAADQPETQVLQNWVNTNAEAYLFIDFHNSKYSNEVSMISGNSDCDKVYRLKKQYLCGIDSLIPYLKKNRGFLAEDTIFSYTGYITAPGILSNYAQSCGITSFSMECASDQNNTGRGSAESVAVGAEVLGNMLLEIYSNVDNTQSVGEIVDIVLNSLINAEGVSY